MAAPLPFAAAASRLAGLLDASAAPPRSDSMPLGVRALLAALAPYAATSRVLVLDAAATNRAAAACRAALVGDQTESGARISVLNAAAAATCCAALVGDKTASGARLSVLDAAAATACRAALVGDQTASGARLSVLNAAAVLDASSSPTLDASTSPTSGTGAIGDPKLSGFGFGRLLSALAPHAEATKGFVDAAAAATSHLFTTVVGAASDTGAPRYSFSTADTCFDPCKTTAVLVVVDPASVSHLDTNHPASTPYVATTGTRTRLVFNTNAGLPLPRTSHLFNLTRAFSTTNNHEVNSRSSSRVGRQKLNKPGTRTTRMGRQVMLRSIDSQLRDMGHFSRRNYAKFFVIFTLLSITSQGVSELSVRVGQLEDALGSLTDILGSLNDKWGLQEGEGREDWVDLVGIMGEDFGWVFK